MVVVNSYPLAIVLCVVTMLCWGSWANTQKAAGKDWRFELFYWDYVFGVVILAVISAFTLGSFGESGRGFVEDIIQARLDLICSALLGGVIFNLANILLVAAIAIAGMSVAFPVGIGLALIVGVGVNYWNQPAGNVGILACGVVLVAAAIVLNAVAYRRLPNQSKSVSSKGLILSLLCGVLMGFFYLFVARTMFIDPTSPQVGYLSPYTAVFFFALGILVSNFLFNSVIMAKPFVGDPVVCADYYKGTSRQHFLGIVGGMIWCVGMDAEHHRLDFGRAGHFLRSGTRCHASGRRLGRFRVARVPRGTQRHWTPASVNVCLLFGRIGINYRGSKYVSL